SGHCQYQTAHPEYWPCFRTNHKKLYQNNHRTAMPRQKRCPAGMHDTTKHARSHLLVTSDFDVCLSAERKTLAR
ncbi:MAG: hypothetical protein ACPHP1_09475, partial [Miltoncostaeaceae bacterium]